MIINTQELIERHGEEAGKYALAQYERISNEINETIRIYVRIGGKKFTMRVLDDLRPKADAWFEAAYQLGAVS